jgi:hypothetical protein
MAEIKSKAVVAYAGADRIPLQAYQLARDTNINVPPASVWIRGSFNPNFPATTKTFEAAAFNRY